MKLAAKYFSCGKFCLHGIQNLYSLWIFDVFKHGDPVFFLCIFLKPIKNKNS